MPKKSLRCHVEIDVHSVTSPGTWLLKRDDLYVSVRLFGQVRRTGPVSAIFPLIFHEKFKFDKLVKVEEFVRTFASIYKHRVTRFTVHGWLTIFHIKVLQVFYSAYEPSQVADSLDDLSVRIELIQLSDLYQDGRLLAWFESSARDFLYPYPSYSPSSYGVRDREVLMERTLTFPGISPRLEFSTKTVIQQTVTPLLEPWDLDEEVATCNGHSSARRSRSRTRSKSPGPGRRSRSFGRPTVSSVSRSRSVSPCLASRTADLNIDDTQTSAVEDRPPFVIRKVENDLIGRRPAVTTTKCAHSGERRRHRSASPTRCGSSSYNGDLVNKSYDYGTTSSANYDRPSTSYDLARSYTSLTDPLLDSPFYRALKARALSPWRYYSTYRGLYDDPSWALTRAEIIRDRVDRALRRDRSLERLERLRCFRTPYLPLYDSLSDLELDFELARRRKYYL